MGQAGSNITADRLRFDFTHPAKVTAEERSQVQGLVNEAIQRDLPISFDEMSLEEARGSGAIALFDQKYGEKVRVYSIGDVSREVCGGPHAERTGALGAFRITKEESSSRGVRRIKAVLE